MSAASGDVVVGPDGFVYLAMHEPDRIARLVPADGGCPQNGAETLTPAPACPGKRQSARSARVTSEPWPWRLDRRQERQGARGAHLPLVDLVLAGDIELIEGAPPNATFASHARWGLLMMPVTLPA